MFITITSLFREVKLITTLIINITQHNKTKVLFVIYLGQCYLRHIRFEKQRVFQNPFLPKLFTEFFGDLIKNPPNICSPKLFAPNIFAVNVYDFCFLGQ